MSNSPAYLKGKALSELDGYISQLNSNKDGRGKKLSYWISDYVGLLQREATFSPMKCMRRKRGDIVKVHLGYRVGSEEGGLHYAIVIDKEPALSSPVLTVIPLTSKKPTTKPIREEDSRIDIGTEVYALLISKANAILSNLDKKLLELNERKDAVDAAIIAAQKDEEASKAFDFDAKAAELVSIQAEHDKAMADITLCKKLIAEISKMKSGSIVLVNQITTISKLRIFDPIHSSDNLSNIRVSQETLDKIDNKILQHYTNVGVIAVKNV